ncbi:DNA polymerase IV [Streptomyces sp. NPDC059479]|uniref:DNA polymerase IV n=1 Tax=Streptomyces sp. NPDC059479 TaxID=3346848 RepID=UPI0036A2D1D7
MRSAPTILHLDMDAFFAAAEQAAKPSLRGKPVVVGGLGPRGVVSTASYEARRFGVHSAMPMAQARRLAPNAAYLVPRFSLYRTVSEQVMELLGRLSPLVEPLSLDEAFVDLEAGGSAHDTASALAAGERLRRDIRAVTGLTGSVGLAGSKMLAKIGSEQAKPDGLVLIEPGTERELLGPMPVRTLPGVGPATGEHLRRAGMTTVAELAEAGEDELVRLLGKAHGASLYRMALGHDDRPVVSERETKSVSVEDTFDVDLHDRVRVRVEVERLADRCVQRLRAAGHSGRTVVLKVRRYDFSTLTRSETLRGPTDDPGVVREAAGRLLESVDTTGGVRLLGVGVTGLADFTQEDLFAQAAAAEQPAAAVPAAIPAATSAASDEPTEAAPSPPVEDGSASAREPEAPAERRFPAGHDVRHAEYGAGWVQGSGLRRVTVRFEEPGSAPGRVRTFWTDDPELVLSEPLPLVPLPLVPEPPDSAQSSWPASRPKLRWESRSDREAGRSGGSGSGSGRARP